MSAKYKVGQAIKFESHQLKYAQAPLSGYAMEIEKFTDDGVILEVLEYFTAEHIFKYHYVIDTGSNADDFIIEEDEIIEFKVNIDEHVNEMLVI